MHRRLEWEERAVKGPVGSSGIAMLHARLGEESAFRWLGAVESHTAT